MVLGPSGFLLVRVVYGVIVGMLLRLVWVIAWGRFWTLSLDGLGMVCGSFHILFCLFWFVL